MVRTQRIERACELHASSPRADRAPVAKRRARTAPRGDFAQIAGMLRAHRHAGIALRWGHGPTFADVV